MTKRLISIFTSLLLLISMLAALPAQAGSVGEWVADFKAAADGKTTIPANSIGKIQGGNWGYNSDGDYVVMNAKEGIVLLDSSISSDYTLGFKMQMGAANPDGGTTSKTYGVNTAIKIKLEDNNEASPPIGNVFWIYPVGEKIGLNEYSLADGTPTTDWINDTRKFINFSNDEWIDVKFVVDVDDENKNPDLFGILYVYLNGVKSSSVEIPSVKNEKKVLGISKTTVKGGTKTLLKDMYAHDGIEFDSKIEETAVVNEYKFDNIMTNMADGTTQDASGSLSSDVLKLRHIDGSKVQYNAGTSSSKGKYGNIKVKANQTSIEKGIPYFEYESAQETDGLFIYSVDVYFNNFNIPYKLAEMFSRGSATATHSSLLEINATKSDTATLTLSYVNKNGDTQTVTRQIKKSATEGGWWTFTVLANYKKGEYPVFTVNASNNTGKIFDNITFTDCKAKCNGTKMNFRLSVGETTDDLLNLPADSTLSVDNLCITKLNGTNKITVNDVKLYQGQNIIKATETFDKTKELKVAPTIFNNSNSASSGTVVVAQYSADNQLLKLSTETYSANAAQNIYTESGIPGVDAPTVTITPDADISYIKVFVIDSVDGINPFTKSLKISAQ